jgi:hypothetical protein
MPLEGIDLDNFHRAMQEKTMRKSDRRLCPTFISGISSRRQLPGPTTRDDGQDNLSDAARKSRKSAVS